MKVSELTGAQLDYWVARAQGWTIGRGDGDGFYFSPSSPDDVDHWIEQGAEVEFREVVRDWMPSTNWAQAGLIIERERIMVAAYANQGEYAYDSAGNNARLTAPGRWFAQMPDQGTGTYDALDGWIEVCPTDDWVGTGPTPLVAAMRAYVASHFGLEVQIG